MAEIYSRILAGADAFFRRVMEAQPEQLQCGRGCSLCCYGLFEIGSGDVPVLAEGLAKLHPARRKKIIRKSREIVESSAHPDLRECSPIEKEKFFARTAETPCPNLDGSGQCMMYEHRPLVCRTFGLPLRNGDDYLGDVCELNFTTASQAQKDDAAWDLLWEDELGPEDQFTIPEAIVLIARTRGWQESSNEGPACRCRSSPPHRAETARSLPASAPYAKVPVDRVKSLADLISKRLP